MIDLWSRPVRRHHDAEHADEPERFGLSEIRRSLRVQPNLSPGYP
jgi:hypothetical protein